jgi:outer membrane protein TolC
MRILLFLCVTYLFLAPNPAKALTMAEAIQDALQFNPQVVRATALAAAAESRTAKAQAPFWPRLEVGYSYWQADRNPDFSSTDLSTSTASASYNLFNGGSDWFNLDAAKHRQEAAKWQRNSVTADIVLAVQQAYIEVLRAEQSLITSQQNMELLRQHHHESELRLEQGLIARNDLLRVSVEMATAQQGLVAAQGDLAITRQILASTLGRELGEDEVLTAVSLAETTLEPFDQLLRQMLDSRSELRYLNNQLAAQTSERKAVRGDLLPNVDLVLSYDRFGNDAFPDSADPDFNSDSTTMLQASWTLFSGFDTRHEMASRKHELLALKEEIRSTADRLAVQLKTALEKYHVASINLATARASVAQAEENYRVNENRYKAQVATTVDLLDASEFLTRTRNEEVKARFDLYSAEAVIDRVLERQTSGQDKS